MWSGPAEVSAPAVPVQNGASAGSDTEAEANEEQSDSNYRRAPQQGCLVPQGRRQLGHACRIRIPQDGDTNTRATSWRSRIRPLRGVGDKSGVTFIGDAVFLSLSERIRARIAPRPFRITAFRSDGSPSPRSSRRPRSILAPERSELSLHPEVSCPQPRGRGPLLADR